MHCGFLCLPYMCLPSLYDGQDVDGRRRRRPKDCSQTFCNHLLRTMSMLAAGESKLAAKSAVFDE